MNTGGTLRPSSRGLKVVIDDLDLCGGADLIQGGLQCTLLFPDQRVLDRSGFFFDPLFGRQLRIRNGFFGLLDFMPRQCDSILKDPFGLMDQQFVPNRLLELGCHQTAPGKKKLVPVWVEPALGVMKAGIPLEGLP